MARTTRRDFLRTSALVGSGLALTDPLGSCMYHHFKHGELKAEGSSITEGIGQGRVTANIGVAPVDDAFQITDEEMLPVLFFALLYKLGDTSLNRMIEPFWVDRGYSMAEIGLISVSLGVVLTILGALAGSVVFVQVGVIVELLAVSQGDAQAL